MAEEKGAKQSKKFLQAGAAVVLGCVLGILDAVMRSKFGTGIPQEAYDLIGQVSMTYLGAQGVVDVGVRVSSILQGKSAAAGK